MVATEDGLGLLIRVIEADAATTVHRIGLVAVVYQGAVLDADIGSRTNDSDAVAILCDAAVADGDVCVKASEVRDADTSHHVVVRITLDDASLDDERIGSRDIDLWDIVVGCRIHVEGAALDGHWLRGIGGTADGSLSTGFKVTIFDGAGCSC